MLQVGLVMDVLEMRDSWFTCAFAFTLVPLMSVVSTGLLFWGGEHVVLNRTVDSGAMVSCVDSAVCRSFQNKPKMYY